MRVLVFTIVGVILLGVGGFFLWPQLTSHRDSAQVEKPKPIPDPETYQTAMEEVQYHRKKLAKQYHMARTPAERQQVVKSARELLNMVLPQMMRCWKGTDWDFNGTAELPGEGKVACGYFVSTIMRDAGFRVERVRLAQQPSQNILRTFLSRSSLTVKSGMEYDSFMRMVRGMKPGVYIVGLDRHVGFIVHDGEGGDDLRFIHSGGLLKRVVEEPQSIAHSLEVSQYRVIGNVTADDSVIIKWLKGGKFPTFVRS